MRATRYKRVSLEAAEEAVHGRATAPDNRRELDALRGLLRLALREEVTDRQRQVLTLYYVKEMSLRQIGETLGLDPSTVSRTLKRGEDRLRRCLRYSRLPQADQGGRNRPGSRH